MKDMKELNPKRKNDRKKFPKRNRVEKKPSENVNPIIVRGHNNIAWRTNDATMTKLVGTLPFGQPLGLPQQVQVSASAGTKLGFRIPGILSIRTALTAGGASTNQGNYNSALNLCMRKIYSFVRHANSGSKNYEAADLGVYMIALGQALGLLGWLQRLYMVVNRYSPTNRYLPIAVMNIMGVNDVDIIANQVQLKYLIAWMGRAVGALAFPDIPYMHACYEAYKWIIRDSDSPKEQLYIIDSQGFGKYDPIRSTTGGGLTYTTTIPWGIPNVPSSYMTFANIYGYVHEIMDVLLSDEDCGIISGDILKAYRDGGLFKLEAFGDYDPFIKDDEVLQQIHNAHVVLKTDTALTGYTQSAGTPSTAPYISADLSVGSGTYNMDGSIGDSLLIDAFSKEPDPLEVVNCTVLNPVFKMQRNTPATTYSVSTYEFSFDLHLPVAVYLSNGMPDQYTIQDISTSFVRYGSALTNSYAWSFNWLDAVTRFDWHPFMVRLEYVTAVGITGLRIIGDMQNSRFFDYEVGERIHENSLLSLFNYNEHNFLK